MARDLAVLKKLLRGSKKRRIEHVESAYKSRVTRDTKMSEQKQI